MALDGREPIGDGVSTIMILVIIILIIGAFALFGGGINWIMKNHPMPVLIIIGIVMFFVVKSSLKQE